MKKTGRYVRYFRADNPYAAKASGRSVDALTGVGSLINIAGSVRDMAKSSYDHYCHVPTRSPQSEDMARVGRDFRIAIDKTLKGYTVSGFYPATTVKIGVPSRARKSSGGSVRANEPVPSNKGRAVRATEYLPQSTFIEHAPASPAGLPTREKLSD